MVITDDRILCTNNQILSNNKESNLLVSCDRLSLTPSSSSISDARPTTSISSASTSLGMNLLH
jgi:hypothetical protein